jgi:hypothetical protein
MSNAIQELDELDEELDGGTGMMHGLQFSPFVLI